MTRKSLFSLCDTCNSGCTIFCVQVHGYGDQSVEGLPVTLMDKETSPTWTHTGTTDSSGKYCYTVTGSEKPKYVTVDGDHCSTPAVFYVDPKTSDTCTATFFYCSFTITFSVNPDANPVISSVPNLFATETRNDDGSEFTWTWCRLDTGSPNNYPRNVKFTATTYDSRGRNYGPNPLWPQICKTVTINCGHDYTLDLVQSYWGDCYYPAVGCDKGCDKGVGPSYRGLISKMLQVRLSSNSGLFADDEGVWIDLTGGPISWTSGTRGPQGNFLGVKDVCDQYSLSGAFLNELPTPTPGHSSVAAYFASTLVTVSISGMIYSRYGNHGCVDNSSYFCHFSKYPVGVGPVFDPVTNTSCQDRSTALLSTVPMCSPCDWVLYYGHNTPSYGTTVYFQGGVTAADYAQMLADHPTWVIDYTAEIRETC